jgi:two-component system KDP operon response regulator KdpE
MARLLLVDDDPAQISVWRLLLEACGHQIETAETVPRAMEKLAVAEPEILLMDLRLPELKDGLALIRRAREVSAAKILVLSGWPRDLESLPEQQLVARVLAKPVRPNTLLRHISELVAAAAGCYGIFLALL